ncbi:MAG: hypothetical protein ACE5F9_13285, partial [Phycisphaerae bacterium]
DSGAVATEAARRVGDAVALIRGISVMYYFGAIFGDTLRELVENKPPMTEEQEAKLAEVLAKPLQ